ncbi:hypothetical protein BESB_010570 [Besnoitia besnoiti]|uniref:Uncharacterized protein n=1 Tax=Besnoitia besnoiti TaxID=94643 RepID=A0A2A9ML24_BESBE|nr:hypothetical protein BESB_010570 [Besnoitia besnoiti]PFH38715.1 hypothetical protein BESB_010570 [Besnoitia besnoiti]
MTEVVGWLARKQNDRTDLREETHEAAPVDIATYFAPGPELISHLTKKIGSSSAVYFLGDSLERSESMTSNSEGDIFQSTPPNMSPTTQLLTAVREMCTSRSSAVASPTLASGDEKEHEHHRDSHKTVLDQPAAGLPPVIQYTPQLRPNHSRSGQVAGYLESPARVLLVGSIAEQGRVLGLKEPVVRCLCEEEGVAFLKVCQGEHLHDCTYADHICLYA